MKEESKATLKEIGLNTTLIFKRTLSRFKLC